MFHIHIPRYERIWLIAGISTIAVFLILFAVMAVGMGLNPPGHMTMDAIDPQAVPSTPPFDQPGILQVGPNEYNVSMIARVFAFQPGEINVPAGATVHFQVTSPDVVHGLIIPGTNVNMMVIPGQVTEFSYTFRKSGEYLIVCHEYCGVGHHLMAGRVNVQ